MGQLFEQLSDKDLIERYVDAYAGVERVNRNIEQASLSRILRFWDEEKQTLYRLLGNQFIIEKEIFYEKPIEEIEDELSRSLGYGKMRNFCDIFYSFSNDYRCEHDDWNIYSNLNKLVSVPNLARNKFGDDTFSIPLPDGKKLTVNHGCKPIRILAKIAQIFHLEGFEEFRLEHSRILNQKRLKGTLCLSIHPLDYMTMSDNTYGWDSCMNWMNEGQYRMGTVEMMNSPYVVVAYLKGSDNLQFFNNEWNSKKWRNLFIVKEDAICSVKGYPYINSTFDEILVEWLAELAYTNMGWQYNKDTYTQKVDYDYFDIWDKETGELLAHLNFSTDVMYNDFNNNTKVSCKLGLNHPKTIHTHYSGQTECMYCGQAVSIDDLEDEGCLICSDCAYYLHCDNCGDTIEDEDDAYELDGSTYCRYCWEEYAQFCPLEEEYHHRENCGTLYIVDDSLKDVVNNEGCISEEVFNDAWLYNLPIYHTIYSSMKRDYSYYFKDLYTILVKYSNYWGTHNRTTFIVYKSDIKEDVLKDIQNMCDDWGCSNWAPGKKLLPLCE